MNKFFKKQYKEICIISTSVLVSFFLVFGSALADRTSEFFLNDGTSLTPNPSSLTLGASSTPIANAHFTQLSTGFVIATSTTASSTFANGINLTKGCFSVNGTCLTTGISSAITGLKHTYGSAQTGATQTFATTSDTNIGIDITNNVADSLMFTSKWIGNLAVARGGTGSTTLSGILKGNGTSAVQTAVAADFPTLNQNTTGTAAGLSSTLAVGSGGTGQTSFGQGWLNSNGTTISASTSPTVNYVTATSTTHISSFVGVNTGTKVNTDGATITVDWSLGNTQEVVIGATGRTLAFSNVSPGATLKLWVWQDATGSRTITTYPSGVHWAGGSAPTLTTTAGKFDILVFTTASSTSQFSAGASLNY